MHIGSLANTGTVSYSNTPKSLVHSNVVQARLPLILIGSELKNEDISRVPPPLTLSRQLEESVRNVHLNRVHKPTGIDVDSKVTLRSPSKGQQVLRQAVNIRWNLPKQNTLYHEAFNSGASRTRTASIFESGYFASFFQMRSNFDKTKLGVRDMNPLRSSSISNGDIRVYPFQEQYRQCTMKFLGQHDAREIPTVTWTSPMFQTYPIEKLQSAQHTRESHSTA